MFNEFGANQLEWEHDPDEVSDFGVVVQVSSWNVVKELATLVRVADRMIDQYS